MQKEQNKRYKKIDTKKEIEIQLEKPKKTLSKKTKIVILTIFAILSLAAIIGVVFALSYLTNIK